MAETIIAFRGDYGAIELKQTYQKYLSRALVVATGVMLLGVGTYWGAVKLSEEDEPHYVARIIKYSELGPPPSLQNAQAPAVAVSAPAVKPSVGIPVPVPDAEVNPEQTIATQQELSQAVQTSDAGTGTGGQVDVKIDEDGPPPDFVPYEKEPVIVKSVLPKYPEIALRAGLEGNVITKVWVDKEGKVRKVVILKSDAEIFNQAAIDAASSYVFTPAVMQKGPVSVWVSIPFRFRLSSK
ncbi:MAG TPA: energy transducer TonB [Bacteroidota bacterium]|nr:energy transducer TonB [Bacteroidota bacterium]